MIPPPDIEFQLASVLVHDINGRASTELRRQRKPEFIEYVSIPLPAAEENHIKLRRALVQTIQELHNLNIRSAMNSGADWLGTFYEVFLKYANWAQKLGIVLTPRHVTRFVADVMDIQASDLVFDPTCGTGGFLVAAFDHVRQHADAEQLDTFKRNGVFGIEQDDGIAALAVVNMIFRRDGKNNIKAGDCMATFLAPSTDKGFPTAKFANVQSERPAITKVMMNPPFALKRDAEKEFKFVDHALKQTQHGGMLFSVLPYGTMVRPGIYRIWREHMLLGHHTLLAVITFPGDLFYPVGVHTLGIFVRKGVPHPKDQDVLWLRAVNDGLVKSKGRRLPSERVPNDLEAVKDALRAFLPNQRYPAPNVERLQKACPIDFTDSLLELVPEAYLDQSLPTVAELQQGMEQVVRDAVAYLVRSGREHELEVQQEKR